MLNQLDTKTIFYCHTTEYWNNAIGYVPANGEIVIYSDYKRIESNGETVFVPGIKIGSGNGYVQDLAFLGEADTRAMLEHINDEIRHVSAADRAKWNNKINVTDASEVVDEILVFNRN